MITRENYKRTRGKEENAHKGRNDLAKKQKTKKVETRQVLRSKKRRGGDDDTLVQNIRAETGNHRSGKLDRTCEAEIRQDTK